MVITPKETVDGSLYPSRRRRKREEVTRRRKRSKPLRPQQQQLKLKPNDGKTPGKIVKMRMNGETEKRKNEGVTMRIWRRKMKVLNLGRWRR